MRQADRPHSARRKRLLPVLAVGLPIAEAAALSAAGLSSDVGLAAQASAVGAFGIFHDLRWLFVFHATVPAFVLGLAAAIALRAAFVAAAVWSAGPDPSDRRSFWVIWRRAAIATAAAALLLAPWVTLLFGVGVLPVSWAFYAALPAALLTVVILSHAGIDADWWRRLPPWRTVAWTGASFLALSATAAAVAGGTWLLVVPILAATGAFNAAAWRGCARATASRPRPVRRRVPTTVVAAACWLVVVVGGSWIGFLTHRGAPEVAMPATDDPGSRAVLLVPGFSSECCGEAAALHHPDGFSIEQFSYAGPDDRGRPRPHTGEATDADLGDLADRMAVQVRRLAVTTGRPVAIVAESEGTLVVAAYLERHPDAPVDRVAMLSPIVAPARVTFPDPGEDGRGVVAGAQLRAMTDLIDALAPFTITVDGPLGDSVRRDAASLHDGVLADRPGIDELAVLPLADAVVVPPASRPAVEVVYVPGFHGGLRGRADVQEMVFTWLESGDVPASPGWGALARVIGGSSSAWQVPSLGPYAASG